MGGRVLAPMGGGTTPIAGGGAVLMGGGGVVDGGARPIAFSEKSENVALDELYNIAYMTWVISETVRPKKAKYSTKRAGEMDSDGVSENAETSSQEKSQNTRPELTVFEALPVKSSYLNNCWAVCLDSGSVGKR
ncbi:hypothetical protein DFH09DRAFT_1102922 [Mycena vulgaris]|nr:hypothetical protein DFH09DRAFT_1102922 [Mycena vulgaris]